MATGWIKMRARLLADRAEIELGLTMLHSVPRGAPLSETTPVNDYSAALPQAQPRSCTLSYEAAESYLEGHLSTYNRLLEMMDGMLAESDV